MNRKVILLILQLETDYFSSYSFQKCSIRSSGITVFTETSRNCILHEEVQGILHILHSTFGYPYRTPCYMQKTKSSSSSLESNSTYRRQRDLRVHPFILQDLPKAFQAFQPQDLPRAFQRFQIFQTFQSFMTSSLSRQYFMFQYLPVPPGFPPHYSILQLECIFYIFYTSTGFHRNSTEYQLRHYKHSTNFHSSKKGRCCDIGQNMYQMSVKDVKLTFTSNRINPCNRLVIKSY